ncbi:MAG: ABC transporter permease [Cyanobacteria bacterium]|nr:ABC transporter permease [Cyanobacteriota bacterium]
MNFDNLRQDIRLAARGLLRAPPFAAITILTLALGIGANTAIFSIVNGVILRPLGYPKPEHLMYLTTQFPAFNFDQFRVSPPEYFEFRELNQSFAAVGAYTTGEVNLTAGDRPLRVLGLERTGQKTHVFAPLPKTAEERRPTSATSCRCIRSRNRSSAVRAARSRCCRRRWDSCC